MTYLDFYRYSTTLGQMPASTVCIEFKRRPVYELFRPTTADKEQLRLEAKTSHAWGSDSIEIRSYEFTELRQNIVLFCAAIRNQI